MGDRTQDAFTRQIDYFRAAANIWNVGCDSADDAERRLYERVSTMYFWKGCGLATGPMAEEPIDLSPPFV